MSTGKLFVAHQSIRLYVLYFMFGNIHGIAMLPSSGVIRSHLLNNINFHVFIFVAHICNVLFNFQKLSGKSSSKCFFKKLFFNMLILGKKFIFVIQKILKSINLLNISCAEYPLHR